VAKKEELKKIIRGKGMQAFRPSAENLSTEEVVVGKPNSVNQTGLSIATSQEEVSQSFQAEAISEQAVREKRLNDNCIISEIEPSQEQKDFIEKILGQDIHQIVIWDIYISQGEKRGTAFKINNPVVFNICCTASGLLEQLKPELGIHCISYDLQRMQIQNNYTFSAKTKPLWHNFQISYKIQPNLQGFFKFHIIVDIDDTDLFWIMDGFEFKIR